MKRGAAATPAAMKRTPADDELLTRALEASTGPALVLDPALRVVDATPEVHALLGFTVPRGVSAASLLCGDRPKRPVAEALAAGRSIQAVIPGPGGDPRPLAVRTTPLRQGRTLVGWVLGLRLAGELGDAPVEFHGMWTRDAAMKRMFRILEKVAVDDVTVLVRGETGSGKELVAHAIHALSPRAHGPLRAINCAALPANLLESELFGHVKGAFTGAVRDTPGHVQLAEGGTLFLDEVAEVPLELQAKLLRVLETRTVLPVGAREPIPVDVRIISATHRSLRREVELGRFRADLMFRLRVIPVFLPALRERIDDVSLLVDRFIGELNGHRRREVEGVSPAALAALEAHDWPGNVRELRNVIEYAFVVGDGPIIERTDLPPELLEREGEGDVAPTIVEATSPAPVPSADGPEAEVRRIRQALERTRGHKEQAARLLGISRITLWRRMKELGLAR